LAVVVVVEEEEEGRGWEVGVETLLVFPSL